jgi:uncharacterized protein YecT (DUF1311 family)
MQTGLLFWAAAGYIAALEKAGPVSPGTPPTPEGNPMREPLRLTLFALLAVGSGARPAMALDCARATAPIEKAICADPIAAAADDAMSKAYDALAARLAAPDKAALLISQRRWLKDRADTCSADEGAAEAACLADRTEARRAYLAGEPASGPGAAQAFTPVLIQHVGKPNQYDLDVNALKFAEPKLPGEKLFNATIDALLKKVPAIEQTEPRRDMVYSYDLDVSASFASPEFVSARVETYEFAGGAHGNSETSNFAIDLESGKALQFSDLFAAGAQPKLVAACLDDIKRQKQQKMPNDPYGVVSAAEQKKTIEQSVGDMTRWSFYATKGEITFDAYSLGAYFEGSYACDFPAEMMRPLLKLDYLAQAAR